MRLDKTKVFQEVVVILCYTLLTLLMTYPLALNFFSHIPSGGDAFQNLWNLWWVKRSLLGLHTSPYYTYYLFHPAGANLAFHTLTIFNSLLAIPLQDLLGLVGAYNTLTLFGFVFSGYGTYLLVKYLTKDWRAAFISGLIFAFCPYHFAHMFNGHLNLISTEWIPFYVLFLIKTHREQSNRNALLAGFFLSLTSLCSWHYMGFMGIFTVFFLTYYLWFNRTTVDSKFLKRFLLLTFTFSILILPFIYPMIVGLSSANFTGQRIEFATTFSADLLSFFIPSQLHPIFGDYVDSIYDNFQGNIGEHTHFTGYTVMSLSIYYVIKKKKYAQWISEKKSKAEHIFGKKINIFKFSWIIFLILLVYYLLFGMDFVVYLLLAVYASFFVVLYYLIKEKQIDFWLLSSILFFLLSLGPFLHISGKIDFGGIGLVIPLPAIFLYIIPLLSFLRDPGRFGLLLMLSLAVMSGFSLRYLLKRIRKKNIFFTIISILILFEFLSIPYPLVETTMPEFYMYISKNIDDFAILEVPIPSFSNGLSRYMYYQTMHEKKIIGGVISIASTNAREFMENTPIIQGFRSPAMFFRWEDKIFIVKNAYFRPEIEHNPVLKSIFENATIHMQNNEASIYYTKELPSATLVFDLDQPYLQGDIIRLNISEIGVSVLNHYNIRYIIVHENDLLTESRKAVNSLIPEILDNPSPVYVDDEITVYEIPKAKKVPFAVLGSNWYIKERWDDPPVRWMSNNATIGIIDAKAGYGRLRFEAKSFKKNRTLEVYLNDDLLVSYLLNMNFTEIEIDNLNLTDGNNTIRFYTSDGCEKVWVRGISFVDDGERCISVAFRNVIIRYENGRQ